jgi:hypothetical protein
VHGSPGGPSLEEKGLRFDDKVLGAEGQAEPPWAMLGDVVLQWLVSASTCICAQSNREVHRASTSDVVSLPRSNPPHVLYLQA